MNAALFTTADEMVRDMRMDRRALVATMGVDSAADTVATDEAADDLRGCCKSGLGLAGQFWD